MASTDGVSVFFDVVAEGRGIQLFYNSHSLHRQRKKSSVHFHQLKHLQFSRFVLLYGQIITVGSVESGYHFIQMLDGPVDLPLRFVVVCVVESITLTKTSRQSKHSSHTSLSLQNVAPNETSPTPVTKVGRDDEEVGRVCQVFAEQFPIFVLLVFAQSAHEDGDDTKVVFTAAKSDQFV